MKKIAYKGFNKDMKCRGMQYEEGKTYTADGVIKVCANGFHACENPLDVLHYYPIAKGSKYHIVECDGDISNEEAGDSKFACREITVGAEITISQLIKAGITAVFEKARRIKGNNYAQGPCSTAATQGPYSTAATQGNCSVAATQGYSSTAATQGDSSVAATQGSCSTAATQGDSSTAIANGNDSIALANGYAAKAKAALGCYIVLTEYKNGNLVDCQCRKVDGEKIKPDTFYKLVGGEFVEVKE